MRAGSPTRLDPLFIGILLLQQLGERSGNPAPTFLPDGGTPR